jgi:hypothetical protein
MLNHLPLHHTLRLWHRSPLCHHLDWRDMFPVDVTESDQRPLLQIQERMKELAGLIFRFLEYLA